jgi:hypothetical protein
VTPGQFLNAAACYAAAAVCIAAAVVVVGVVLFAGFVAVGYVASLLRPEPESARGTFLAPDGTPMTTVHFRGGQVGTTPTNSVPSLESEYGNRL